MSFVFDEHTVGFFAREFAWASALSSEVSKVMKERNMKKSIVTGIVALVVVGLGASASAVTASPSQLSVRSVQVSFADLNINSDEGAQALYRRLKNASEKACSISNSGATKPVAALRDAKMCYASALSNAVTKIDSDALSRIHTS